MILNHDQVVIVGHNVWDDEDSPENLIKLIVRNSNESEFDLGFNTDIIFDKNMDDDLAKVLLVYEFYNSCRKIVRRRTFADVKVRDLYKVEFTVTQLMCALATVRVLGNSMVRDVLYNHQNEIPSFAYSNLYKAVMLHTAKGDSESHIDLFVVDDNNPKPFPEIINLV